MNDISTYHRFAPRRPGRTASVIVQLLLRALDQARGGKVTCVQVGANDGKMADPVHGFLTERGWHALLIEPHPVYFADLQRLHGKRETVTCLNVGVSDKADEKELYFLAEAARARFPRWIRGCASLDRARLVEQLDTAVAEFGAQSHPDDVASVTIRLDRLGSLLKANRLKRADVLVVDVEGHEVPVLAGADLAALDLSLAIVECNGDVANAEPQIVAHLAACGLVTFRVGAEIVGIRPGRLSMPMEDVLCWIGVQRFEQIETTSDPDAAVSEET